MITTSINTQERQDQHQQEVKKKEETVKNIPNKFTLQYNVLTKYKNDPPSVPLATTTFSHVFLPIYKVVAVGDCGAGKSNLLSRFTRDRFDIQTPSTIGVEFTSRESEVPAVQGGQMERVIVQLWDTAGQERCGLIITAFFRNAVGAVFVYDVTRENTLTRIPMWVEHLRKHTCEDCVYIVIGNKTDLSHLSTVSQDDAEDIAHRLGMRHFLASALNGNGVTHAFMQLVLALNAEQQVKRSVAAAMDMTNTTRNANTTGGGVYERVQLGSLSISRFCIANGTVWSVPLSSLSHSFSSTRLENGRQMDLRGFGSPQVFYDKGSKLTSNCCS
ncbi:Small GTPase [Trypanosoma melophagium]|uniref:Small GTPase n=1 Tax=Trypanosoma melophagium TaxID=715481 RepID=UPI00351A9327|nr:Small GTPase [Trypanosoma melophagium]